MLMSILAEIGLLKVKVIIDRIILSHSL